MITQTLEQFESQISTFRLSEAKALAKMYEHKAELHELTEQEMEDIAEIMNYWFQIHMWGMFL